MGQVIGIFTKKNNNIFNQTPLYAEEESYYSLANIFLDSNTYINKILESSTLEEGRKNLLKLTDKELSSLIYNNVQDFADDEIEYRNSSKEQLPENFRAIKMKYDPEKGEVIYSDEYESLENWSEVNTIIDALYKVKEVLFEDLKKAIQNGENTDYRKYSFDNIQILLITIKTLKKTNGIDEVALIYAPY